MKFIELKVFTNKRNGQSVVSLPKKSFGNPSKVKIVIPKTTKREIWRH
jgi:hypothetical protein